MRQYYIGIVQKEAWQDNSFSYVQQHSDGIGNTYLSNKARGWLASHGVCVGNSARRASCNLFTWYKLCQEHVQYLDHVMYDAQFLSMLSRLCSKSLLRCRGYGIK